MKKHLFFLCMTFLSSTFVFAQSYTQNFGTGNGDGRSWDNTVFQTATDGTKTVTVNFNTNKTSYDIFSDALATEANKVSVFKGETFSLTINGGIHWIYARVYVDWNGDGSFDEAEESTENLGYNPATERDFGSNSSTRTYQITVPDDATIGDTRIRVALGWKQTNMDIVPDNEEKVVKTITSTEITDKKNAMVRDFALAIKENTIAARTITVMSTDDDMGTVAIEGTNETSLTTSDLNVTVIATPADGCMFIDWVNANTQNTVSTSATYVYSGLTDITLIARFTEKDYPIMYRTYTTANQQNRYLKEVVATVNSEQQTVFSATTQEELPYTEWTAGTVTEGALIDKTGTPIKIKQGTGIFSMTFKPWTNNITIGGVSKASELVWTSQACFIDWNGDKDFEDDNEIYEGVGMPANNNNFGDANGNTTDGWTREFSIPNDVALGTYRMRVVYAEPATSGTTLNAETFFANGQGICRNGVSYDFAITIEKASTTALQTVTKLQAYYSATTESIVCEQPARICIYDMAGKMLLNGDNISQLSVATLNQGIYIANVNGQPFKFVK